MNTPFLVKKEDQVLFNGNKLEIYLPKDYFEKELAEELGMKVASIAIFPMIYYKDENSKGMKLQFKLPETIEFGYTESREETISIKEGYDEEKYVIYTLYNNDIFIESLNTTQSYKNTERLVNLHNTSKIPHSVKYEDILNMYLENMLGNKCNLGVPSSIIEIVISELARDKNNVEIPFRKALKKNKNLKDTDYKQISIKELAMVNSTFTAISSEDMNAAITSSVNKARTGGMEVDTPIEKTIKY